MNVQTKHFQDLIISNNIDKLEKDKNYYFLCQTTEGTNTIEAKNFLPQSILIDSGYFNQKAYVPISNGNVYPKNVECTWYYEKYSNNIIHLYTNTYKITNDYASAKYQLINTVEYNTDKSFTIYENPSIEEEGEEESGFTGKYIIGSMYGFYNNYNTGDYWRYGECPVDSEYYLGNKLAGPLGPSQSYIALAPHWGMPLPWGINNLPSSSEVDILYSSINLSNLNYWSWVAGVVTEEKNLNIQQYTNTINEILTNKGTGSYSIHIVAAIKSEV